MYIDNNCAFGDEWCVTIVEVEGWNDYGAKSQAEKTVYENWVKVSN